MSPEMQDALELLCKTVDKKYGTNTISKLTAKAIVLLDDVIDTNSIGLNTALGVGGYKRGRIIEIFGPNASGKTTASLHAIANTQKNGYTPVFLDMEHCFDPNYAQNLGVDLDRLLVSQPECAEDCLDIAEMCVKTPSIGLVVIDSVTALVPRSELEGEMSDQSVGLQARLMSKAMRKLVGNCSKTNTTLLLLNQLRALIGGFGYGPKEGTSGGNAIKYYASQRLDIRSIGKIKQGEDIIGNRTRVKVVKNKLASPFKQAEFDIIFGRGIDSNGELIDLAIEDKIIIKSGAWYKYGDESIAQGRPNAITWLNENPEIKEKIRQEILSNRGLGE